MVSGFLISPNDQERIRSGEAIPIWIWSNVSGLATGFAKLVSSFMSSFPLLPSCLREGPGVGRPAFLRGPPSIPPPQRGGGGRYSGGGAAGGGQPRIPAGPPLNPLPRAGGQD